MHHGWSRQKITFVLYPFAAGAMAVNIFFASLIGSWIGFPVLSPILAIASGCAAGVPAAWIFAGHIQKLIVRADGQQPSTDV